MLRSELVSVSMARRRWVNYVSPMFGEVATLSVKVGQANPIFPWTPASIPYSPLPGEGGAESQNGYAAERGATILVVDDDDDVRESVAWLLEDEGYRVTSAANGREALAALESMPLPALALIDLRMPIMDGFQLIEALRGDPSYSALPVIAFSAASTLAPPSGVPLLKKPIATERLLSAIRAKARRCTD